MALFLFTNAILEGRPIEVFNQGQMQRDVTYVSDVVEAVVRLMVQPAEGCSSWSSEHPDPSRSQAPYRVYNVRNTPPVALLRFIEILEEALGKTAEKVFLPMQLGDVTTTFADTEDL